MRNLMFTNNCVAGCKSKINLLTIEIESLKSELDHTRKSLEKSVTDCCELKVRLAPNQPTAIVHASNFFSFFLVCATPNCIGQTEICGETASQSTMQCSSGQTAATGKRTISNPK